MMSCRFWGPAITCALEHYTAMLADYVLRNPVWLEDAEPQLRVLWSWHAAEETEHKAVAYDVYRAAGGGYAKRVLWYLHVSVVFWLDTFQQTAHNLHRDGRLFAPRTWTSAARSWSGRRCTTCRHASILGSMTTARCCRCGWSATTALTGPLQVRDPDARLAPGRGRNEGRMS